MRTAVILVLLCACDQGAIEKPKPAAAVAPTAAPEPWRLPDAPFTSSAWSVIKPVLTLK